MTFNKTLVRVAENAIKKGKTQVDLNASWQFLNQEYNIGLTQGTKLKLSEKDRVNLLDIVALETGINLLENSVTDLSGMHREDALRIANNEKWAGKSVKRQRLALKSLAGEVLAINQQQCQLPESGHLDISLEQINSVEHNCILIVENYRCFDQLAQLDICLPKQYQSPLVVYRGDDYYSEKTLKLLLRQTALPVIAMMDIDLQSLLIARRYKGVVGLMCANLTKLEYLLANQGNLELYAKQLPGCQQALNTSEEPVIQTLWALLRKYQKVWVQENDLIGEYAIGFMAFNGEGSTAKPSV